MMFARLLMFAFVLAPLALSGTQPAVGSRDHQAQEAEGQQASPLGIDAARALRRNGYLQEAERRYVLVAALGPRSQRDRARLERAQVLLDLDRPADALRVLDRLRPRPGVTGLRATLLAAGAMRQTGDLTGALAAIDAYIVATAGGNEHALATKAALLAEAGRPEEATALALTVLPGLPDESASRLALDLAQAFDRAGDAQNAIVWYAELAGRDDDASALLRAAELKQDIGDPTWTDDALRTAGMAPSSAAAADAVAMLDAAGVAVDSYVRGLVAYRHGDYATATGAFGVVVHSGGARAAEATFYLGAIAEDQGRAADAIALYSRSVELNAAGPLADDALWWKAFVLQQQGRIDEALDALAQLASGYPGTGFGQEAPFRRGYLLYGTGLPGDAAAAFGAGASVDDPELRHRALYWQAKALAAAEDSATSETLLSELAAEPTADFYTLRAIVALGEGVPWPPVRRIDDTTIDWVTLDAWVTSLEGSGSRRALDSPFLDRSWALGVELLSTGLLESAEAEFDDLLDRNRDDMRGLYHLARAFQRLGLSNLSARAATRLLSVLPEEARAALPRDAVRLAYPVVYADLLHQLESRTGVDPLVMLALIRQESFYDPGARSFAGALGLTQVMPGTGQDVAGRLGWDSFDPADLVRPYVSVEAGGQYIFEQLRDFDGDLYHALAAYNGGPGTAASALAAAGGDLDVFVEELPFAETRLYVRLVMTHLAHYRFAYEGLDRPALPSDPP